MVTLDYEDDWTRVVSSVLKHGPGSLFVVARLRGLSLVVVGKPIMPADFIFEGRGLNRAL